MSKLVMQGPVLPLTHDLLILLRPVGKGLGSPSNEGTIALGCHVQGRSYQSSDIFHGCLVPTHHGGD